MTTYEKALWLLYELFSTVQPGNGGWKDWVHQQIEAWRLQKSSQTFREVSTMGGMGSFNDLVLCVMNGHRLTKEQEPWANYLLLTLQGFCSLCARHPDTVYTEQQLSYDLYSGKRSFEGFRCSMCGYADITLRDIDNILASELIPRLVIRALVSDRDEHVIARILSLRIPGLDEQRRVLTEQAVKSGIAVSRREGWLRPCPRCGSDDTRIYRWHENDEGLFEPEID